MAIVVKKSDENLDVASLYTFGRENTAVFVGLGNPGGQYDGTRHNIGFDILDEFARASDLDHWTNKTDLQCELTHGLVGDTKVYLIKPTTFMNNSGKAVQAVLSFYKLSDQDVTVIHDEIDLEFGTIQSKQGGGTAGHNGLKDITKIIGQDYKRLRIGIGPKEPEQIDLSDFVLQSFSKDQQENLPKVIREATSMLGEATATDLGTQSRSALL